MDRGGDPGVPGSGRTLSLRGQAKRTNPTQRTVVSLLIRTGYPKVHGFYETVAGLRLALEGRDDHPVKSLRCQELFTRKLGINERVIWRARGLTRSTQSFLYQRNCGEPHDGKLGNAA